MSKVDITKRVLTDSEITLLINEIKTTPNIIGFTAKEWRSFGQYYVAIVDGKLAGICLATSINRQWSELTMLYVLTKYRRLGIGRKLFNIAWEELRKNHQNIYCVSRSEAVLNMMKEKQMKFVSIFSLPWALKADIIFYALKSIYRIKEFFRKLVAFPGSLAWHYGIKKYSNV